MTNKQHPAQFDWATELSDAQGHVTLSAKEAHEIGARLRSMGDKLKAYEDHGTATQAQAVNQADRPFIVRLAEDFAEDCVTAGYVTTKAASYGRLMDEALSTQPQAGAVPLTQAQVVEAFCALPHQVQFVTAFDQGVRFAERHHGIKGGQHGTE